MYMNNLHVHFINAKNIYKSLINCVKKHFSPSPNPHPQKSIQNIKKNVSNYKE